MQPHSAGVPKGSDTHLANRCFIITVNEARMALSDRSHAQHVQDSRFDPLQHRPQQKLKACEWEHMCGCCCVTNLCACRALCGLEHETNGSVTHRADEGQ